MAVIKKNINLSLRQMTGAALALPGLLASPAQAADGDEIDFQYSHYQEGKRQISGLVSDQVTGIHTLGRIQTLNPIEADSLRGSARISLTDRVKFAFNYIQDTWGGATPVATAPATYGGNSAQYSPDGSKIIAGATPFINQSGVKFDGQLNPLFVSSTDIDGKENFTKSNQLTHILSTASPETRKQGDFKLTYEWDETALSLGGGISVEDDYESHFGNLGGRFDFNHKQTTLDVDVSYTHSDTHATVDHDAGPYLNGLLYDARGQREQNNTLNQSVIRGVRQDWATHLGLSQILNKDAIVSADFTYTRSTGYQANPYKTVTTIFIDPNSQFDAPPGGFVGRGLSYLEQRPEVRNQWSVGGRYVQFIQPLDAAFHFDYRFSADDWGIQAHTFEADWVQPLGAGWTITPRIRYYSQDAAVFYTPWLLVKDTPDESNPNQVPTNFSSDQRLSGYGALSGGVTVTKQFAKGLALETGFEYYTHQGSMKLGGGGEGAYADFDYWVANAALKVNLATLSLGDGCDKFSQGNHQHHAHNNHNIPAGIMFGHTLPKAGDMMMGYRYQWSSFGGGMLRNTATIGDQALMANACGTDSCFLTPHSMNMTMHMLDVMYAPTDWLTLMLMPQFMDMGMDMRQLPNRNFSGLSSSEQHGIGGHLSHHLQNNHETGGIGDLGMFAMFKLYDNGAHHLHGTIGFSAPTGEVDIHLRRNHQVDGGFMHYGMQLGSGTWDFKPSLTYTGQLNDWSWGAQVSGVVRMEKQNESGYRLGNLFQTTAWGSYSLSSWLSASVRGVYTAQESIQGQFTGSAGGQFKDKTRVCSTTIEFKVDELGNVIFDENGNEVRIEVPHFCNSSILKFGPQDYPQNYGGKFWDVGFGLNVAVPSGAFAGNRLALEWLQPVYTNVNGYQLDRDGALNFTWSYGF